MCPALVLGTGSSAIILLIYGSWIKCTHWALDSVPIFDPISTVSSSRHLFVNKYVQVWAKQPPRVKCGDWIKCPHYFSYHCIWQYWDYKLQRQGTWFSACIEPQALVLPAPGACTCTLLFQSSDGVKQAHRVKSRDWQEGNWSFNPGCRLNHLRCSHLYSSTYNQVMGEQNWCPGSVQGTESSAFILFISGYW